MENELQYFRVEVINPWTGESEWELVLAETPTDALYRRPLWLGSRTTGRVL